MLRIGAHVSIAGGYQAALDRAHLMGANTLQIFSTSPRGWGFASVSDSDAKVFREKAQYLDISPIFFHASYLINLAGNGLGLENSVKSLISELTIASKLGIAGSVVHVGSFKNSEESFGKVCEAIREVLSQTPEDTYFIIENAGTRKIGVTLEHIVSIIEQIDSGRLRVCLDTCHLHAAGYDLGTEEKLNAFLDRFDSLVGLDRLKLWHVNDSKDPFNSFRDRHQNIGEGEIGKEVFRLLLKNPRINDRVFIIEVPGFGDKGPDKQNIDILKKLSAS